MSLIGMQYFITTLSASGIFFSIGGYVTGSRRYYAVIVDSKSQCEYVGICCHCYGTGVVPVLPLWKTCSSNIKDLQI